MTDTSLYPQVVSFCGPRQAGKGTATSHLLAHGYVQISFARPLKDMLIAMGLTEEDVNDPVRKEQPHPLLGGHPVRWGMQSLGCQWMRELICQDGWVTIARHRIEQARAKGLRVCVDDNRFSNEGEMLQSIGAPIIEITRPGRDYSPEHASEAGLPRHLITATVANDGTPEQLHARLHELLVAIGAQQTERRAA